MGHFSMAMLNIPKVNLARFLHVVMEKNNWRYRGGTLVFCPPIPNGRAVAH